MLQSCSGYAVLLGENSFILNIHDIRIPRIWKNIIILPPRLEYGIARWLAYIPETSEADLVLDYDTIPAETEWIVASSADGFRLGSVAVSPISNSREYGISRIPFELTSNIGLGSESHVYHDVKQGRPDSIGPSTMTQTWNVYHDENMDNAERGRQPPLRDSGTILYLLSDSYKEYETWHIDH